MTENILVAVAWPYANARIHVGNITGSYLPADIYARYHRLKGNQVLMVSGSDAHGTPITIRADAEGSTAEEVYQRFHIEFLELFQKLGLSYDLFTSTHTINHTKTAQAMFLALHENGYLYRDSKEHWFSPKQNRFLPDRYIEGTCALCGYENARSDQCDSCGSLLESNQLLNPHSTIDDSTPELRETEHFYLDLGKLEGKITEFLNQREEYWRPNVLKQSLGQINADGLHGRPITRDLEWGIPVPIEGWDGKSLYVWFEAVIGYISAAIEWASLTGDDSSWQNWWLNTEARSSFFIGKDNIPFHAVIFPGELIGAGTAFCKHLGLDTEANLTLPYDVPANEFLNLEGKKISGSRNWVIDGLDFLTRYDPDPLRYYLTINMPVNRDADWDWEEFHARNNNELVATWGNLVNRVLSFAYKHWEGVVPDPGKLQKEDIALLNTIEDGFEEVGNLIDQVKLRRALRETVRLAAEVNKYLDTTAPWFVIKEDKNLAARSVYTALRAIDSLKILFSPFIPFSSERLHTYLGNQKPLFGGQTTQEIDDELGTHTVLQYDPTFATGKWEPSNLSAGNTFLKPSPLFVKLDKKIIGEERARLGT